VSPPSGSGHSKEPHRGRVASSDSGDGSIRQCLPQTRQKFNGPSGVREEAIVAVSFWGSGKRTASPPLAPLRTGCASFPTPAQAFTNAPRGTQPSPPPIPLLLALSLLALVPNSFSAIRRWPAYPGIGLRAGKSAPTSSIAGAAVSHPRRRAPSMHARTSPGVTTGPLQAGQVTVSRWWAFSSGRITSASAGHEDPRSLYPAECTSGGSFNWQRQRYRRPSSEMSRVRRFPIANRPPSLWGRPARGPNS
jgi:hypothetical protein